MRMILQLLIVMQLDTKIGVAAKFNLIVSMDTIQLIPPSRMGSNKNCQATHQLFRSSSQRLACLIISELPQTSQISVSFEQSKHQSNHLDGHPSPNGP